MVLTYIGTGMLWVGWYGFNSGSAVGADVIAANAFTTTTHCHGGGLLRLADVGVDCREASRACSVSAPAPWRAWWSLPRHAVSSLPHGAVWIGIAAGSIPWFFCYKVKGWFGYDDALDTFGVHGIGGTTGALMTGMLGAQCRQPEPRHQSEGPMLRTLCSNRWCWEQLKAIGVTLVLAIVGTIVIAFITKALVGLRPTEEVEISGLDVNEHGEEGYHQRVN